MLPVDLNLLINQPKTLHLHALDTWTNADKESALFVFVSVRDIFNRRFEAPTY